MVSSSLEAPQASLRAPAAAGLGRLTLVGVPAPLPSSSVLALTSSVQLGGTRRLNVFPLVLTLALIG